MLCSLGSSSWVPSLSLFNNTQKLTYISHPYHQPKLLYILMNSPIPSFTINPSLVLKFPSCNSHFKLKPHKCCALQASVSCLPEPKTDTEERRGKLRAGHFADEIRAIPVEKRCNFINSMIEEQGQSKSIGYINDVIMGLVIADELDIALKVFDEMPLRGLSPDSWTYSVLIRCYCRKNEPDVGKEILDCMVEKGFRPNVVTLTILVNSFCSRGKLEKGFEVVEMMDRIGCNPNVHTYNCVLKGLCYVGRVEQAYDMLMSLKNKDVYSNECDPDIYSYTAVMDGFCKVGRSNEAMELLDEAIKIGLIPNVITYNTLFNGYCKEGKPRKGLRLLKQMKERGCMPDYISYITLIHGFLKWDKLMAGFWVYKEMVEMGFKVDERMMNDLLRGLCRASWTEEGIVGFVDEVFVTMKSQGYTIFPDTYYIVCHTFCIAEEVDKALVVLYEMVEVGCFPRMVTINRIIRGLCEEKRIHEALSVLNLVCEASRIPSKISYNILIDELNRQGNVLGACNVYGAALKLGVLPHQVPLCLQSK